MRILVSLGAVAALLVPSPAGALPAVSVFAGTGFPADAGDGGPAVAAQLSGPYGVAADVRGDVFIAEVNGSRVRKVAPDGVISTVAGTGVRGFAGDDGPATAAQLKFPYAVAVDHQGDLFIADRGNGRIRKVDAHGIISTIASNPLGAPIAVAVNGAGDVYESDGAVRKIAPDGSVTTVLANQGPVSMAFDTQGNLFMTGRNQIDELTPGGRSAGWLAPRTTATPATEARRLRRPSRSPTA